ncbi:Nin-like protein [Burkholderia cenocepacia]|uniref:Nin-like protein n=1 Tax=Burkholderia cenocepacia TaxID=95486 RepID=UPI00287719A2|nr:Nin-like protein [Burkholderia cenocepacia]MDS0801758.1 Nin-like protein [Burkholderia cenocepacia]
MLAEFPPLMLMQRIEDAMTSRNPYLIDGPAQICFSGGRTSGYLLHQILEANAGLPKDVHVTFQNTGKERAETLDFIQECAQRWNVHVNWLEWDGRGADGGFRRPSWKIVDYASADRIGTPFERLIAEKGYLPNVAHRICTANLKIRVGEAFMRSLGHDEWDSVMGIRADEPRRATRMMASGRDNSAGMPVIPLYAAGVTKPEILAWWKSQPFDLRLDPEGDLGNCDLCFLKARAKNVAALRTEPERAIWWIKQERAVGNTFIKGYVSYADLIREADFMNSQIEMFPEAPEDDERIADCMCGD